LRELLRALDAVRDGDLSARLPTDWLGIEGKIAQRFNEIVTARLRASEARFRSLAERMPHLVWESDAEGRASYHNPRWYDYTGAATGDSLGDRWLDCFHPDDRASVLSEWRKAIATGGEHALDLEVRLRRADGVYRWFRLTGEPVPDASGTVDKWVGTCTDIEERKRAEEGLREADRRKDVFLATLAHELRNPLAPIRNTVKLLRQVGANDAASEWGRDVIERQVEQLTRLVDDLLDVSRITRGKVQLQLEPLDLATVVAGAVETSRPMIDARRHALRVHLPREPVPVQGDLVRLTQVVSNLLNNAAKFQEEGGEITVSAERQDDRAVIRVRDRGVGIPPEMLGKVFDLFAQAEGTVGRSEGGLGIGLSLAKSLVELHGGRIQASSAGRGRGAEFCVSLPCSAQRAARAEAAPAQGSDAPLARARRVLIVDDNRDAAESLAMVLSLRGYDTLVCHEGQEAVALAQRMQPHIVLLDLGLPGLDGFEVCRRLREHGLDKAHIVAITGYGQDEDRRRSRDAGFDEHFVKPVDPDALMRRLEAASALGDRGH
jgi:two-component system CheB/CheR fusion protein